MKILHITASYKPAFIYGGPIYSVAALCEALEAEGRGKAKSGRRKAEGASSVEEAENDVEIESSESDKEAGSLKRKAEGKDHLLIHRSTDYDQNTTTVEVYTTLANGKEELPYRSGQTKIIDGVAVAYFKRITKDHSHFSPALLFRLWKNAKNFNVVHIHAWWNLVSMGSVLICLLKGIKPIISPRGMLGDYTLSKPKLLFHRFIGKHFLKKCNFHATTAMEADEILKQVFNGNDAVEVVDLMSEKEEARNKRKEERDKNQNAKIFIIHNLVKLPEKLPVKTRVFDGTLKLIFLSRIHHKKGIELLLEALALVNFPFHLTIVGDGEKAYVECLKLEAENLNLGSVISWLGPIYGNEKFKILVAHDLLVLPSYNENFANVVIESIAVETPVLVSEMVGLKDWVFQNKYGLVCKNELNDISGKLKEIYKEINESHKFLKTSLNINNNPASYFQAYERI